jgi:ssDNA-binding Zn-finger/Zn-ribbon topoisomerase 1
MLVGRDPTDPMVVFIQSRADVDFSAIDEYAAQMTDGVEFEPAQGLMDTEAGKIYVWDGYHRGQAALKAGLQLWVAVEPGSRPEAEWLALTANQRHGLRRTTKDKQRIVRAALLHPNGLALANREIARHVGVDHKTVGRIRRELEASGEIPQVDTRTVIRGDQTFEVDTGNIGTQPAARKDVAPTALFCPICRAETVHLLPLGLECIQCGKKWGTRIEYDDFVQWKGRQEADAFGVRWCPVCGQVKKFSVEDLESVYSASSGLTCPHCDALSAVASWLREPPDEPAREEADLGQCLRRALDASSDRWAARQKTGLSNAALVEAIAVEFGLGGGTSGPGQSAEWHRGGKNPAFWYGSLSGSGKPTLRGAALRDAVRELLEIPFPIDPVEPRPTPPRESVLCPKCDQAIFPDQDTRPDGSIVCDACKKKFKNYEALVEQSRSPVPRESVTQWLVETTTPPTGRFAAPKPDYSPTPCPACHRYQIVVDAERDQGRCDGCAVKFELWGKLVDDHQIETKPRRKALSERAFGLYSVIAQAPVDRLYEIEAWFDEIETAFAAPPAWAIARNGEGHA